MAPWSPTSPELFQGDGNTTFLSLEGSTSPAVALSPALAVNPADDQRSRSPSPRRPGRKSISLGLEELPLPTRRRTRTSKAAEYIQPAGEL